MRTPEVRDALETLAGDPRMPADLALSIRGLVDELRRRPARGAAPVQSVRMTPARAAAIRAYVAAHPGKPQTEVAAVFNVNPGRVSEAIRGKRS